MSIVARFLIVLVSFYRLAISPLLGPSCRYQPTCSAYAIEAIRRHGGRKGFLMAIRRIMRCHPFGGHGYDPVPDCDETVSGSLCRHDPRHPQPLDSSRMPLDSQ